MSISSNGSGHQPVLSTQRNGSSSRCPRRLVLLMSDEQSQVTEVLAEYKGADISGKRLHTDLQQLAKQHPGRCVAAEWLGPLGWTRFLWCRR